MLKNENLIIINLIKLSMNKKYLFGMLLSGALLTACTADDALDANKVSKDANMSAPVFTVSLENGDLQNRAHYAPGNNAGNKVNFDPNDKMSLYHGFDKDLNNLKDWQNAIYLASEEDEEGNMSFSTQAMVQRGCAVMVYPADLGFDQMGEDGTTGEGAPVVTVSNIQDATTKDNTPYISDFLLLADPKTDGQPAYAGYGETYDIKLRRAAGTLRVVMDKKDAPTVANAPALEVRAVEIEYDDDYFSTAVPLMKGADLGTGLGKTHKSWKFAAELDLNSDLIEQAPNIKTKDISGNDAYFTILPVKTKDYQHPEKGKVRVYTNYGIVTIGTEEKVFGADKDEALDGNEGVLYQLTQKLWVKGVEGETEFVDQYLGKPIATQMIVDMKKLTLDGLHIDNETDLNTALTVYDALYTEKKDQKITITLDGKNGTFEMSPATLKRLSDHMIAGNAKANEGLKFEACNLTASKEQLDKIKVTNSGAEFEVPSLIFNGTKAVSVELAGPWKWTDVTVINNSDASKDKSKRMNKVKGITFLKGAVVTLQNNIAVRDGESNYAITVNNGATVNVNTPDVDVYVILKNSGTINIGQQGRFRAGDGGTIENCAQPQDNKNPITGLEITQPGLINNNGVLGVVDGATSAEVNNYGLIDIKTTDASTLVTTNAMTGADITSDYANNNVFGVILLDNANENMTTIGGEKGFIKKTIKGQPTAEAVGNTANYIILDEGCDTVKCEKYGKVNGMPNSDFNSKTGVRYIEVKTTKKVTITGATNIYLEGLIVPKGCRVDIEKNATVVMNCNSSGVNKATIYLDGTLVNAGNLRSFNKTAKNDLADGIYAGYFGEGSQKVTIQQ